MTGILLAGGRSIRMGKDKRHLILGDVPLLILIIRNMKKFCRKVLVEEKNKFESLKTAENVEVEQDIFLSQAPLVGLYTGLVKSQAQWNFVQSCDMPFVSNDLVRHLASYCGEEWDWILPSFQSRLHPMCSFYAKTCLPTLQEAIEETRWKIVNLQTRLKTRIVPDEEISRLDPSGESFVNINTPKEYDLAVRSIRGEHA